jgi:hypothetical protein
MKDNKDIKLPTISKDLLEALDTLFPETSPNLSWSEKECFWFGGQRNVIRFLHEQFKRQNETILNKE